MEEYDFGGFLNSPQVFLLSSKNSPRREEFIIALSLPSPCLSSKNPFSNKYVFGFTVESIILRYSCDFNTNTDVWLL